MSRRTRTLLFLPGLLFLAVLVVVSAPFLLIRIGGIRDFALDHSGLPSLLSGRQRLRVERVLRCDPTGITLAGVRIESEREGEWRSWLRIGTLSGAWDPVDLLASRFLFSRILLDSVSVEVDSMPQPLLAAGAPPSSSPVKAPRLPLIRCSTLQVSDLVLKREGKRQVTGGVRLRYLEHEHGVVRGTIESVVVRQPADSLELTLARGSVRGHLVTDFDLDSLSPLKYA